MAKEDPSEVPAFVSCFFPTDVYPCFLPLYKHSQNFPTMGDTHTYSVTSNTTGLDLKKMIDERFNGEIETTFWCIRFIYPKVGIIKDYDTVWGKINVGTEKGTPPVIYGSLMCLAGISAAASDEEGCEGGHLDYQEFWIRKYMNNTFKGVARGSREEIEAKKKAAKEKT